MVESQELGKCSFGFKQLLMLYLHGINPYPVTLILNNFFVSLYGRRKSNTFILSFTEYSACLLNLRLSDRSGFFFLSV